MAVIMVGYSSEQLNLNNEILKRYVDKIDEIMEQCKDDEYEYKSFELKKERINEILKIHGEILK